MSTRHRRAPVLRCSAVMQDIPPEKIRRQHVKISSFGPFFLAFRTDRQTVGHWTKIQATNIEHVLAETKEKEIRTGQERLIFMLSVRWLIRDPIQIRAKISRQRCLTNKPPIPARVLASVIACVVPDASLRFCSRIPSAVTDSIHYPSSLIDLLPQPLEFASPST